MQREAGEAGEAVGVERTRRSGAATGRGKKKNPESSACLKILPETVFVHFCGSSRPCLGISECDQPQEVTAAGDGGEVRGEQLSTGQQSVTHFLCVLGLKGLMTNCEKGRKKNVLMTKLIWTIYYNSGLQS